MKNSAFVKTAFVSVLLIAAAISSAPTRAEDIRLIGSGASFPFPSYAKLTKMNSALLQNKAGNFVEVGGETEKRARPRWPAPS